MTEAWPEALLASNHRKWRALSEEEWDAVRRAYLAGASARDLADRHDVGLSTLRQRAREGGWRRLDRPADSDLFPADADRLADHGPDDAAACDGPAEEARDWDGLLSLAHLRLRRALVAGQSIEAGSWMRLYDRLDAHRARRPDPRIDPMSDPDLEPDPESACAPEPRVQPGPEPEPGPRPDPDPAPASTIAVSLEAVEASMRNVQSIARRAFDAAARGDGSGLRALEAEVAALEAMADALPDRKPPDAVSDSSDSLDGVFSPPVDYAAERERLTTLRRRRLELGLGVTDINASLAALAYQPPDD